VAWYSFPRVIGTIPLPLGNRQLVVIVALTIDVDDRRARRIDDRRDRRVKKIVPLPLGDRQLVVIVAVTIDVDGLLIIMQKYVTSLDNGVDRWSTGLYKPVSAYLTLGRLDCSRLPVLSLIETLVTL